MQEYHGRMNRRRRGRRHAQSLECMLSNKLQKEAHHQQDEEETKEERNKRLRSRKNPAIFVQSSSQQLADE
jgi:hypothetical protein